MKQVELEQELTRLLAQESAPESLVGALREHRPDANELGSLASRLALRGVPLAPTAPPPPAAGASKAWLAVGGGALAVAGVWLALRTDAAPAPAATTALQPPVALEPAAPTRAPGAVVRPESRARSHARSPLAAPSSAAAVEPATAAEPSATDAAPESPPAGAAEARARASVERTPSAPPAAIPLAGSPAPHARGSVPAAATPPSETVAGELRAGTPEPSEIELLREARMTLRSSPARSLELSERHARSYPGGKLVQERELIAITALVSLGRRTAALARAARFEQSFPTSPYRKQLSELLQ